MKKFSVLTISLILLLSIILDQGCQSETEKKKELAKARVIGILEGILDKNTHTRLDEERACCLWWRKKTKILDIDRPKLAKDEFNRWRQRANIFPLIKEYTIIDAQIINNSVLITGTINKSEFVMNVPDNSKEVSWIQMPGKK